MVLKKVIAMGTIASVLLSVSPTNLATPKVSAAESGVVALIPENNMQNFRYDFENDLGYASVTVPEIAFKGETFYAGFSYDWGSSDTMNALQVLLTIDADSDAVFIGAEGSANNNELTLSEDGKSLKLVLESSTIREGIYGVIESNNEEMVNVHVFIDYANIDDNWNVVNNTSEHNMSINVIDRHVLNGVIDEAITTVSELPNLSEEEKEIYISIIQNELLVFSISNILEEANTKDSYNLSVVRDSGMAEMNTFEFIPTDELNGYIEQLTNATTISEINEILDLARSSEVANTIYGDVNGSGTLTVLDVSIMKAYLNSGTVPERINLDKFKRVGDMNNDGEVTLIDYMILVASVLQT